MSHIGDNWKNERDVEAFIEQNSIFNGRFLGIHNADFHMKLTCEKDFLNAYNACSPLKAIISKRSRGFNSGIIRTVNPNTLKEVKGGRAAEIRQIVKKPNVLQTESQYQSQLNHYVDLFGYCPILKIPISGMPGEYSGIWNIPPWLFDIDYTKKWIRQNKISGIYQDYYMYWNGEKITIPFKDLFFVFDDLIGTECDSNLTIPDSRLIGCDYIISNIIAAQKARNTLITKRGAIGILSNESKDGDAGSVPLTKREKENIQHDFKKYGLVGQSYQIIITDANLKWQQMGFATKDLMLFEEIQDDIDRLCDIYNLPAPLMARSKDTTFDNQNQSRKDFIENTIIPESASRMEQFTNGIVLETDNLAITRDYSKLAVLQEDKVQAATARKTLNEALQIEYLKGLITKNDWREKLGDERLSLETDPAGDEYYDELAAEQRATDNAIAIAGAKGKSKQPKAQAA